MEFPKLSGKKNKEDYLKLSEYAKKYDHSKFLNEVNDFFGYMYDKDDMDNIGLYLQICVKKSRPLYLHGYVISSALQQYILNNKDITYLNILETGTARGFSSIVMANILKNNNIRGKINTIDWIGHQDEVKWNCIDAPENKKISRHRILDKWSDLRDNYINFITGDSNKILKKLDIERIHFAFLDGAHFFKELTNELNFVEKNQKSGDIIVCDDYTQKQFPDICKAIDKFLENKKYEHKIFYGDDGTKKRGYVFMKRK